MSTLDESLLNGNGNGYNNNNSSTTNILSNGITHGPSGEYISKQQSRTSNSLSICGIPFNILILICICFLTFGSYWVFDTPGALKSQLINWFQFTDADGQQKINAMYSVYSFPNMILALFGGFIVDKLTVRKAAIMFCVFIALGDTIFGLGVQYEVYWVTLLGRFIFGLGGESLTVAQNTYTVRWFDGQKLALVFGLVVAFSRIGTSVNFIVSPIFADPPYGVPFSIWFGCGMCGVSLLMGLFCAYLDKWGSSRIDNERSAIINQLSPAERYYIDQQDALAEPTNDTVDLRDIRLFPFTAWLLYFICMFFYISILTFNTVAQSILTDTGNKYNNNEAGYYMSIPSFVAIIASPIFGYLVDKSGRGLYWIALASIGMTVAHIFYLLMAYQVEFALAAGPIPIMIWIGIFYSMGASAIWPILSFVLDKRVLGTGYGAMTAIQNFGLAIFPLIIGAIQGAPGVSGTTLQYTIPIIIFIGCTCTALMITLLLIQIDSRRGKLLNASAAERLVLQQAQTALQTEAREQDKLNQQHQQSLLSNNYLPSEYPQQVYVIQSQ